ncbi:MAG: DNA polymerase IV, partial [archaeon]|nr:DNA polymerase IV [archaeon]
MKRIILHLDMDAFFAQVEERESPHFKGKPVVVGADPKDGKGRGVVSTANYKAREYGIHSAMPISEAWRMCPTAIFLPVQGRYYGEISSQIMEIIKEYCPVVEQVSVDEAYCDVSFTKTYKEAEKLAETIQREVWKQQKLTCSCGVGPNKMMAKIACEAGKPNGITVITNRRAEKYLEPLSVRAIPG